LKQFSEASLQALSYGVFVEIIVLGEFEKAS